jgi:hypothetical protein
MQALARWGEATSTPVGRPAAGALALAATLALFAAVLLSARTVGRWPLRSATAESRALPAEALVYVRVPAPTSERPAARDPIARTAPRRDALPRAAAPAAPLAPPLEATAPTPTPTTIPGAGAPRDSGRAPAPLAIDPRLPPSPLGGGAAITGLAPTRRPYLDVGGSAAAGPRMYEHAVSEAAKAARYRSLIDSLPALAAARKPTQAERDEAARERSRQRFLMGDRYREPLGGMSMSLPLFSGVRSPEQQRRDSIVHADNLLRMRLRDDRMRLARDSAARADSARRKGKGD